MNLAIKFLPIFFVHFIYILCYHSNDIYGDEIRYITYATNLSNGFYTASANPYLVDGPGYPLFLTPFIALNIPLIIPKLLNAVFIFGSTLFLYKALVRYTSPNISLVCAYILGLYFPFSTSVQYLNTEPLVILLSCCFIYFTLRALKLKIIKRIDLLVPAFLIGYIALTRLMFVYVLIGGILFFTVYYAIFKNRRALYFLLILILGSFVTIPYFLHTYQLTNRIFYVSSNGGEPLYWMSAKYPKEYGSWCGAKTVLTEQVPYMHPDRYTFLKAIDNKPWVERNDLMMQQSVENIRNDPRGYALNVLASIMRLLLDYPYSYSSQNLMTYKYMFPNLVIVIPLLFSIYPAWVFRQQIPFEVTALLIFAFIYTVGSALVGGTNRYFWPVIPTILLWIGFIYGNFVQFSLTNRLAVKQDSL
jgi:hypothetical protein